MKLVRGLHNIREQHKGCVLTIGKFDGVHLGHRAVIENLIVKAKERNLPATVMIFEPQPEEVFQPQTAPARLSSLRDKYLQLKSLGVDRLICVGFDEKFAGMSAECFISEWLVKKLGVSFLVVGDDFRFGRKRKGDFAMLQQEGARCHFDVVSTQSFRLADCRISSSAIRDALAKNDFSYAQDMLGRRFVMHGKVIHGEKKGRSIGFPTANIGLKGQNSPLNGVFAVRVESSGEYYSGVANIGHRPTVGGTRRLLEVHLFDFTGSLYGNQLQVEPVAKIRDEQKFASFELLKQQIVDDADQARTLLARN